MRILVAHNVPRARNGGMSRIQGLIHDEIEKRGAQVEYFCAEDVPQHFQNPWSRFTFPYLVWQRAREGKFDIVNVHEPSGALVTLLKGNSKVVVTSHGVEQRGWQISLEDEKLGRGRPWGRNRYIHPATSLWQSRLAFRNSNHVFCLNEEDREFLNTRFGIPQSRTTRIFPAAGEAYSLIRDRDYKRFRRLLFAGTWLVRKGRQDAVEAFSALADKHPHLEFATLGAGASLETIQSAFPPHLRHRVTVFNPANDSDGAKVMAESDLFLLPSVFEGTPLTLMEAMHSGMPIITTNVCGMRDVIRDGENGLLVPVRSSNSIVAAIERLAADPTLRQKIGTAAREEGLSRYTWTQSAKPVWDVYRGL
jgi:glycosyltransferase involved in cell wall biosynthesis